MAPSAHREALVNFGELNQMKGVGLLSKESLRSAGLPNSTRPQAIKAFKDKEILREEEKLSQKITRLAQEVGDLQFNSTTIR